NLVFLIDVSGSMSEPNKLPLVKSSLRTLAEQLSARDRVAIVTYAGTSGLVLPSTPGDRKGEIVAAVDRLQAGGSTNGGEGIQLAYRVAQENFIRGGTNRVILSTDGDFNVGMTSDEALVRLIAGYRLIGYENRLLAERDFNDDRKDAGEIGAGHTVTALYEIVPAGQRVENPGVDELKYQQTSPPTGGAGANELMTIKLRYKEPDGGASKPLSVGVPDSSASYRNASENFKFSAAVAEFGMLLRDSRYKGQASYDAALELARASTGADLRGYRTEFVKLVETAKGLSARGSVN